MEENKDFSLPEEETVPPLPDAGEEMPLITELTMHPLSEEPTSEAEGVPEAKANPEAEAVSEAAVPDRESASPEEAAAVEAPAAVEEAPVVEAPAAVEETAVVETPAAVEETAALDETGPVESGADFMTRIPEAEEDPELTQTIEAIEALLDKPVDQDFRCTEPDPEFDAMLKAPAPQKQDHQEHSRPTRKGRPKRRRGEGFLGIPSILVTFVWLALILAIGVTSGRMLWVCAADVLAFGREDKPVTITIYETDTMEDIVDKLHRNGLIRYKSLFNLYASISDAEEDIKPGIYDLNTRYDYHALVNFMSPKSSREVVELTIPEGYSCQQIFELLEENRVCTALDVAAYAANGELNDYWFLEGVERGSENCLEGYLFPDTYEFYKNSTPREALQRMLNNFEIKFTEEMQGQIATLNERLGADYTIREIAIVASLIEKESASPSESPKVAGVIYNRLFNWGDNPRLLGIDAAIVYAQGGNAETIDTQLDSPYNTYRYPGLVPGPIANPGLASLKAALEPEMHGYYYYVLNPSTGVHQFSATLDEHNAWISEFYG